MSTLSQAEISLKMVTLAYLHKSELNLHHKFHGRQCENKAMCQLVHGLVAVVCTALKVHKLSVAFAIGASQGESQHCGGCE